MLENFIISIGLGVFATLMFSVVAFGRKANAVVCLVSFLAMGVGLVLKCIQVTPIGNLINIFARPFSNFSLELISLALCVLFALLFLIKRGMFATHWIYGAALIVSLYALWAQGAMMFLSSRPAWNIVFVPLIYMVSALALGGSFTGALHRGNSKEGDNFSVAGATVLLMIFLIAGYCVYLFTAPFPHYSRSIERLLTGDLAPFFWISAALYAFSGVVIYAAHNTKYNNTALAVTFLTCTGAAFLIKKTITAMGTSAQQFIF